MKAVVMKTIAQTIFRLVVTASCLWLVARSVDVSRLLTLFSNVHFGWIAAALAVFWAAQVVSSLRCAYIARHLGGELPLITSLHAHFVGLWFNQVLPSGLGGDVVKMAIMRKPLGLGLAVRSGILDRASGLIFLMATLGLTLPLYRGLLNDIQWLSMAVLVAGFFVALVAAVSIAHVITNRLVLAPWLANLFQILKDVWQFRRGRALWQQVWTSAIVHANGIASYMLISIALGFPAPVLQYILLVPLVFLVALMPVSLAGWGVREAGAVWLFGLVGIAAEQAMAISIGYGVMLIISAMPGLLVFLVGKLNAGHLSVGKG
jgi:uncharacterized membrane protein YbhN (UPF0104 family)